MTAVGDGVIGGWRLENKAASPSPTPAGSSA